MTRVIERHILNELMKSLIPGTVTMICGPRCSGKTTLLKMAADRLRNSGIGDNRILIDSRVHSGKGGDAANLLPFSGAASDMNDCPDSILYRFYDEPEGIPDIPANCAAVITKAGISGQLCQKNMQVPVKRLTLWPCSLGEILTFAGLGDVAHGLGSAIEAYIDWPEAGFFAVKEACEQVGENAENMARLLDVFRRYQWLGGYPQIWKDYNFEDRDDTNSGTEIENPYLSDNMLVTEALLTHAARIARVRSVADLRRTAEIMFASEDAAVHPLVISRMAGISFVSIKKWIRGLAEAGLVLMLNPRPGLPRGHVKMKLGFVADPGIRNALGISCSSNRAIEEYLAQQLVKLGNLRGMAPTELRYWCSNSGNRIPVIWNHRGQEIPFTIASGGKAGRGLIHFLRSSGINEGVAVSEDNGVTRITQGQPSNSGITSVPVWALAGF